MTATTALLNIVRSTATRYLIALIKVQTSGYYAITVHDVLYSMQFGIVGLNCDHITSAVTVRHTVTRAQTVCTVTTLAMYVCYLYLDVKSRN